MLPQLPYNPMHQVTPTHLLEPTPLAVAALAVAGGGPRLAAKLGSASAIMR